MRKIKTIRLSSKRQIALPKQICDRLGIRAGQELTITELAGQILIMPKPKSYTKALRQAGKDLWRGIDPLTYIREERASWDRKR